jgi:Na+/proline symporter
MTQPLVPLQQIPPEVQEVIRNQQTTILAILSLYILLFLFVTALARREYTEELTDFAVASRQLGWIITSFTLFASISSGVGMLGFPGTVYAAGIGFTTTVIFGFSLAGILIWFFGRRIWIIGSEYDFVTPGDLLGDYYESDLMRIYTVIISVMFNIFYIVAQLAAGGILINVLTGGAISTDMGVVIVGIVIAIHVISTGVRGIAYFDTLNGGVQLIVFTMFAGAIIVHAGGLDVFTGIGTSASEMISLPGPAGVFKTPFVYGTAIGLTLGLALMTPTAWMRFYATDERDNFARLGIAMAVLFSLANLAIYLIGVYGRALFPNIENPDFISSIVAFEVLPIPLAALFLIGVLAAIVSTSDSYIHALSTTVGRDFVRAIIKDDMSERLELFVDYGIVALTAVAAIIIALFYRGLITPLAVFAAGLTVQMIPPTFGALRWPRASYEAALLSPAIGTPLMILWELGIVTNPLGGIGLRGLLLGLIVNIVVFVVVTYMTSPVSKEQIDRYHGLLDEKL